jgi:hypothetical protein
MRCRCLLIDVKVEILSWLYYLKDIVWKIEIHMPMVREEVTVVAEVIAVKEDMGEEGTEDLAVVLGAQGHLDHHQLK